MSNEKDCGQKVSFILVPIAFLESLRVSCNEQVENVIDVRSTPAGKMLPRNDIRIQMNILFQKINKGAQIPLRRNKGYSES